MWMLHTGTLAAAELTYCAALFPPYGFVFGEDTKAVTGNLALEVDWYRLWMRTRSNIWTIYFIWRRVSLTYSWGLSKVTSGPVFSSLNLVISSLLSFPFNDFYLLASIDKCWSNATSAEFDRSVHPWSYGWIFARRRFSELWGSKLLVPVGKAWFRTGGQTFFFLHRVNSLEGGGNIILWFWLSTWQWGEHLRVIWYFPDGLQISKQCLAANSFLQSGSEHSDVCY